MNLEDVYTARFDGVLVPLARKLEEHLSELLQGVERIDRVAARPKSVKRFLQKAAKKDRGILKYADPINQIQDQIGARVVCFYLRDVNIISSVLERYMRGVEQREVTPERDSEFGYFGKHYIQFVPRDVVNSFWDQRQVPEFFELQIKTLFQHAWSEADHDLGYKPHSGDLNGDQKRRVALSAAQAWGADRLFDELFEERDRH